MIGSAIPGSARLQPGAGSVTVNVGMQFTRQAGAWRSRVTLLHMTRYVAFLRAINVGGHVVKMEALRKLFESMGFQRVETYIASGNVIFDSEARKTSSLEKKIEDQLKTALGYEVGTFLRSIHELTTLVETIPFVAGEIEGAPSLQVGFVRDGLSAEEQEAGDRRSMITSTRSALVLAKSSGCAIRRFQSRQSRAISARGRF